MDFLKLDFQTNILRYGVKCGTSSLGPSPDTPTWLQHYLAVDYCQQGPSQQVPESPVDPSPSPALVQQTLDQIFSLLGSLP